MYDTPKAVVIQREVEVTMIPFGEKLTLQPMTEAFITQSLGSNFTLNVQGNLVSLAGQDADAIGEKPISMPIDDLNISDDDPYDEKILWQQLETCYDPEIPVNIVDLGLIYDLNHTDLETGGYHVGVRMTLTAPGCGMGPVLAQEVEDKLLAIAYVKEVDVVLVFDPPWDSEMMSETAKLELGVL